MGKKLKKKEGKTILKFEDEQLKIEDPIKSAQVAVLITELIEYSKMKKAFIEELLDNQVDVTIWYNIKERVNTQ